MLIVAIPKSASTSLLQTLGDLHNFPAYQDVKHLKLKRPVKGFEVLSNFHGDCRELDIELVDKWVSEKCFYKQHILPTKKNLALLKSRKKVILLREAKEIILAYKRAQEKGIHERREVFEKCKTNEDWLSRAEEIGLLDELNRFILEWKNDKSDKLVIHYEDLINDTERIVKEASQYFDLSIEANNIKLKKLRYSQYNNFQKFFYKLSARIGRIFR